MKHTTLLLAAILCSLIVLGGCSRPASDAPAEDSPAPPVEQEASGSEPQDSSAPSGQTEQSQEEPEQDNQQEDEETSEPEKETEDPSAADSQGCYLLFDSGFEITVKDPFVIYYDPLAQNMTVTSSTDPNCLGYLFYDTSAQGMVQLEDAVKTLEDSVKGDPTVTDLKTSVEEQDNGLFAFTFTYSAGAVEGSPAGFYFIHYQKTENGILNVNLFSERSSDSEMILELIDSIQPATDQAVEYSESL
jgi:hypothetical protein